MKREKTWLRPWIIGVGFLLIVSAAVWAATPALRVNGIDLGDGSTLGVSASGHIVIRNNAGTLQQSVSGAAYTAIGGGGGGTQNGTTTANHVPYASSGNTLADGELSFNTHTYSVASTTVMDFSAATTAMKGPSGGVSGTVAASTTEFLLTDTLGHTVVTLTPGTSGLYEVTLHYRVQTGTSDVTVVVTWTDAGGSESKTITSVAGQAIGSYPIGSVSFPASSGSAITVTATAGTANRVLVTSAIRRANN